MSPQKIRMDDLLNFSDKEDCAINLFAAGKFDDFPQ